MLGPQKAARYEASHLDEWMPTDPNSKEGPRAAWKVQLYDGSNRYVGWVVLDEKTGDPLQMGETHGDKNF